MGYFLVVKPKKDGVTAKKAEVTKLVADNNQLQVQITQLLSKNKQITQKQVELASIAKRIPSDPSLSTLLHRLQADARDSDVNLVSITPGAPTESKAYVTGAAPYQELSLALEVRGTYASLREWFSNLEDADKRLIVVEQVTLKGPDASKASGSSITIGTDGIPESPNMIIATITARTFDTSASTVTADLPALTGTGTAATSAPTS